MNKSDTVYKVLQDLDDDLLRDIVDEYIYDREHLSDVPFMLPEEKHQCAKHYNVDVEKFEGDNGIYYKGELYASYYDIGELNEILYLPVREFEEKCNVSFKAIMGDAKAWRMRYFTVCTIK